MPRVTNGKILRALEEQSGARFTTTRVGLDTGQRVWLISTEFAAKKEPKLGTPDVVYKGMYLDSIDAVDLENGFTQITGNYIGIKNLKQSKPDVWDEGSDSEYSTLTQPVTNIPYTAHRPRPRVTHTYLASRKPSLLEIGQNKIPDGYPAVFQPGQAYPSLAYNGFTVIFSGWILSNRSIRRAGLTQRGSIYEVTDVYVYEYSTVPEGA